MSDYTPSSLHPKRLLVSQLHLLLLLLLLTIQAALAVGCCLALINELADVSVDQPSLLASDDYNATPARHTLCCLRPAPLLPPLPPVALRAPPLGWHPSP